MFRFIRSHYIGLLTIALCIELATLGAIIIMKLGLGLPSRDPTFEYVMSFFRPPYFIALFALYGLIFSRQSRDEYLETIWQRSMRSFAVVVFLIPWVWLAVWEVKVVFFYDVRWLPRDPNELIIPFHFADPKNASELQMSGVEYLMGQFWIYSPVLFAVLFRWYAWRDRS